jgi:hypothetical protein
VAFSSDAETLITVSDGSKGFRAVVWDISRPTGRSTHALERACLAAGRGFTRQEWAIYVPHVEFAPTCEPR